MNEDDQSRWLRLLVTEDQLRANLWKVVDADETPAPERWREWWLVVSEMLLMQAKADAPLEPTPWGLMRTLHGLTGHLAAGRVPPPMALVEAPGRIGMGPEERRDVGWATAYMQLARADAIADPAPNKTVRECYGVQARTVQGWAKLPVPWLVQTDMADPARVAEQMRNAGARYRVAGRSAVAVRQRGRRPPSK